MAEIITDGKGNYLTLDASGRNWVPTEAPQKEGGYLGYPPAPPEEPKKTATVNVATRQQGEPPDASELGLSLPQGGDTGAVGRIGQAAVRGYQATAPEVSPGHLLSPVNQLLGAGVGILGGAGAAIGQGAYELGKGIGSVIPQVDVGTVSLPGDDRITYPGGITIDRPGRVLSGPLTGTPEQLGRDFYTANQLLPAITMPATSFARAPWRQPPPTPTPRFVQELHGEGTPQNPLGSNMLASVTDAIRRADQAPPPGLPPGERPPFTPTPAQPTPAFLPPGTSAYPPSMPRAVEAGPRVDFAAYGTPTDQGVAMPPANRVMPGAPDGPPAAPPGPVPSPTPRGAAGAEPIMSAADIQARARGHFSAADQAAAQGSMLPDENAAAVRKIFSDAIPTDQEQARIAAARPTVQAAKNVDASGPMSYDTAMMLDRDLTERLRGASGSDRHEVGLLQAKLREQMDQVPELDSLAPGRQAYKQYIKQSQVEDINYGASLKNDPAAADAYVRQRTAALLKNESQMRNWTPEERAAAEAVAKSGDIGMLGRLGVSLIKPVARVAGGGLGGFVAGPGGMFVGSEVGADIGATQAARLRAALSKTTLDEVSRQITRGVPPPPS